jgi:catechol 2,3-dioxygenase-like lactoylglutathione lyase family enzyme
VASERVRDLIPFVHVADVQGSIEFYEKLGFRVRDTHEHDGRLDWAAVESGKAQLTLARASTSIQPDQQAILFYVYSDDLAALRERLVGEGIAVSEIRDGTPGPRQEIGLSDPDGYCLMIAQIE